jgi:hypothetical protein
MVTWDKVTPADVLRAVREYDRLGPEKFFAKHGFSRTLSYDLMWEGRAYPPKAILGTAYEFATGKRLASGDFEGGRLAPSGYSESSGSTFGRGNRTDRTRRHEDGNTSGLYWGWLRWR